MRTWRSTSAILAAVAGVVALASSTGGVTPKGDHKAGQALYESRCAKCHGANGAGDGRVAQLLSDRPRDWTAGEGLEGLSDEQVVDIIRKGGPAVGKSSSMIAFPRLSHAEVWNLVAHIRTLQQ